MGKQSERFVYESLQDIDTVVTHLRAVADGLAQGRLRLASDDRELVLQPQGLLRTRLKAGRTGARNQLLLKLSWRDPDAPAAVADTLQISSDAPDKE